MNADKSESKLVTTWADVEGMIRTHSFPKWAGRLLVGICGVVVVVLILIGIGYFSQNGITSQLHSQSLQLRHEATQLRNETQALKAYTDQKVQNECQALELLTRTRVPKPANPQANPSREATYRFYVAIKFWETKDGCKP